VVILIKNSVAEYIELGIKNNEIGRKKPEIVLFNSAQEAHAGLKDILKPGDVILFQNDWGDQYL
jgi:UDP-N-acetylmuramyl pentapeptide synthase